MPASGPDHEMRQLINSNKCLYGQTLDLKGLSDQLKTNTFVQQLEFLDVRGVEGEVYRLAEALRTNTTLKQLSIVNIRVAPEEAKSLARSPALKVLELEKVALGDSGAEQLAASLKLKTCSLQKIDLKNNSITEKGLQALTDAIKQGSGSLVSLGLSGNGKGEAWKALKAELDAKLKENKEAATTRSPPQTGRGGDRKRPAPQQFHTPVAVRRLNTDSAGALEALPPPPAAAPPPPPPPPAADSRWWPMSGILS